MYRIIDKTTKLFLRDDTSFNEETEIGLDVKPASGLYKPMWNGETWVEGLSDEELTTIKAEQEEKAKRAEKIAYLEATNYVSNNYNDLLKIDATLAQKYFESISDTYNITVEEILTTRAKYIASLNDF